MDADICLHVHKSPPVESHLILPTKECDYPSWLCQPNCGIFQENSQ